MIIHSGYKNPVINYPVVTTGVFDGVHLGHRALLSYVVKHAAETGGESVVVTFNPHPRIVLQGNGEELSFLTTLDEKIKLLDKLKIDHLVVLEFNKTLASYSACDFVRKILVEKIGTRHLIVGYDHHFGKEREGNYRIISDCGRKYGFEVEQLNEISLSGSTVSSTAIREALLDGRLEEANVWLGYSYQLTGTIVKGKGIGHLLGFPTANILPSDSFKLIPANGVYAVEVHIGTGIFKGMLSIGTNPTISRDNNRKSVEVNIFDFNDDLYGSEITVVFRFRLRDEMVFENREQLSGQLENDRRNALKLL